MFISDLELLYNIYRGETKDTTNCPVYKADRLISLGLLDTATKSINIGSLKGSHTERYIQVNELGKKYCQISLS